MDETTIKLDLGCGPLKKEGFIGIDQCKFDCVDYKLDLRKEPIPYEDNTVSYVFSSHFMEHLAGLSETQFVLSEIVRVCKNNATVEIWTPYVKSNEAFSVDHKIFYQEVAWIHICMHHADAWQASFKGRLVLKKLVFHLFEGVEKSLAEMKIPIRFALDHLWGIAWEIGAYMGVIKDINEAKRYQTEYPQRYICYSREGPLKPI